MSKNQTSLSKRWINRTIFAAIVLLGLGAVAVGSFLRVGGSKMSEAARDRQVKAPSRVADSELGESFVKLDAQDQERNGLKTVALKQTAYARQILAYGTVLDIEPLIAASNGYANAKAQLRTADAKLNVSQAAFARAQQLFKNQKDISAQQFQADEGAFRIDEAARTMAESQIRTVAASARQAWGLVLGQAIIDNSPMVTRLIERKDFLLQVTLPLGEAITTPPTAAFVRPNNGRRHQIEFISPATKTDPRIQGISFFYIAPAATDLLSGMNVSVFLASGPKVDGVVVPKAAVVSWQGRAWVYVRTAPEQFTRREIATDNSTGTGYFQSKGFSAGDEVVVNGAQMLLSEEVRPQPQPGGMKAGGGDDDG